MAISRETVFHQFRSTLGGSHSQRLEGSETVTTVQDHLVAIPTDPRIAINSRPSGNLISILKRCCKKCDFNSLFPRTSNDSNSIPVSVHLCKTTEVFKKGCSNYPFIMTDFH